MQLRGIWRSTSMGANAASLRLSKRASRSLSYVGIAVAAGIVGAASTLINTSYALKALIGIPAVVAFLRYPYVLLLAWCLTDVFVGSTIPIFNGNNIDTALTLPTLLLMAVMPIRQTFKRLPALAILLFFLLWMLAGIGSSPLDTLSFLKQWLLLLNYVAVAILVINVITTRRRMLILIDAILMLSALIAVYGIYGYFTHQNGVFDLETGQFRATLVFGEAPPAAALFLSMVILLALYRFFTLDGIKRVLILPVLILLLAAVVVTFTRLAFLSIPLSVLVIVLFLPSRRMKIGLLAGVCASAGLTVIVAAIGNVPVFGRFLNQDVGTFNGRTYLWQALLNRFDPTQLFGNGQNASNAVLTSLQIGGNGVIATSPSNLFIGALYDQGIIGATLLAVAFLSLSISLILGMRRATDDHRVLFAVALAVVVSMVVQSFDQNDFLAQAVGMYFWVIVVLPFAACWSYAESPPDQGALTRNEATSLRTGLVAEPEHAGSTSLIRGGG